ncbi:MAG: glycosyltransferase family 9 protein [Bdellovibrionales bacterium]|nr:glycosyltransferase family 9 protein [Bdellovibrionales bacterium]
MKRRYAHKENVLLVNITRLGDMLQATPTIAGLKQENPNCRITVLVEKQFESVCKIIPGIDEVISLDLGMTVRSLAQGGAGIVDAYEMIDEVVTDLRSRNFDYTLNMSSSAYTALLLRLVGVERRGGWVADEEGYRVIESDWARLFASSVFHSNRIFTGLNLVDIFRCSADVDQHPKHLLLNVDQSSQQFAQSFIEECGFTNKGPLIAVQAGASQGKRQWNPSRFARFVDVLVNRFDARVVLTGTAKELPIVTPIKESVVSNNVAIAAGKTNIPQLSALLRLSDLLVTGDTGPMHISVAVGTPVVSMFLASAYGFETGPYSEGNLVLQPVIGCGPCNPNKGCARPDCHDTIDPEVLAELTMMRVRGDIREVPSTLVSPKQLIVYRTTFDEHGFYDMDAINLGNTRAPEEKIRKAYRRMWLDDLADLKSSDQPSTKMLAIQDPTLEAFGQIAQLAGQGEELIRDLVRMIHDERAPSSELKRVNEALKGLDEVIEKAGFQVPELGPVTRMFVFSKENISGSDASELASQMAGVYQDLFRRSGKLAGYYSAA